MRGDRLARHLALWGVVGGLGFPIGQSLQAFRAWHPELIRSGIWGRLDPVMNWWNWMETTFGAVMGACLGLGLWLNRRRIAPLDEPGEPTLKPALEGLLLAVHLPLLVLTEFAEVPAVDRFYDLGLALGLIPLVAVAGGRWWPLLMVFPVTALPIVGKTIRHLVYEAHAIGVVSGWLLYGVLPLALATGRALGLARQTGRGLSGEHFARWTLLGSTWFYFGLNLAFCGFPWPWRRWTARTPNAIVFAFCALGLTLACLTARRRQQRG